MRDAALVAASLISFQVKHTYVGGMVVSYHTYHRVFITILFQLPVASPRFKLVACSCQVWYTDSKKIPSEVQHDDGCRETLRKAPQNNDRAVMMAYGFSIRDMTKSKH